MYHLKMYRDASSEIDRTINACMMWLISCSLCPIPIFSDGVFYLITSPLSDSKSLFYDVLCEDLRNAIDVWSSSHDTKNKTTRYYIAPLIDFFVI